MAHYLLHPGQETSAFFHHVGHVALAVAQVVLPVVLLVVALLIVCRFVLAVVRRAPGGAGQLVTIAPGPEVEPQGGAILWQALHGVLRRGGLRGLVSARPHVAFQVTWSEGRLSVGIWVPAEVSADRVLRAVEAAWPSAVAETVPASPRLAVGRMTAGQLRLAEPEWFSLKTDFSTDPLRLVFATLGAMSDHSAVVQVLARPARPRHYRRCRRAAAALRSGRPRSRLMRCIDFWMTKGVPKAPNLAADPLRAADVRAATEKASALCFEATIRYGVSAPLTEMGSRRVLRSEAHGLVAAYAFFDGRNRLTRRHLARAAHALGTHHFARGDLYSLAELAALAHVPEDRVVGLSRAGAHVMAPPPQVRAGAKVLGHAEVGGHQPVGLSVADARQHLHVLGATGSGKSTLLANLVLQDVLAHRGAVVVDPKGDLVRDILDRLPEDAVGQTVVLDPDEAAPPAMNVLDASDPHLAVDHLVGIFHRLFAAYWGPRTDDVLRVAALSVLRQPGATLADIPRVLTDTRFRAACTRGLTDPVLCGFWDSYEALSPAGQAQMVGPVMNKLRVVLTRPFASAVLGAAASSFDMGDVLDGGLLLARLPKGILGDDCCRLLGAFIVAKVWQCVTERARSGEGARGDAALYLDEAQHFLVLPGSVADMLAEARGYRLSVVAAHQHLSQLPPELRDALSANARNKAFFNCSPEDARVLARHVVPELADYDLSHLGAFQAAARLVVDGEEVPACTLRTEALPAVRGCGDLIRAGSERRFGRSAESRHDEALRRSLAAPRGAVHGHGGGDGPAGRSVGSSPGRSGGRLELPGSPLTTRQRGAAPSPAGGAPDSWSDQ